MQLGHAVVERLRCGEHAGDHGVPFVSFGRPWGADDLGATAHHWVDVDGASGTAQATAHALRTAGARVAFLGWPAGSATGDDRERGWRETLPTDAAAPRHGRHGRVRPLERARRAGREREAGPEP